MTQEQARGPMACLFFIEKNHLFDIDSAGKILKYS